MKVRRGLRERIERAIARSLARRSHSTDSTVRGSAPRQEGEGPGEPLRAPKGDVLVESVAREFQNVTVGLIGHLSMLRRQLPEPLSSSQTIQRLEETAASLRELVLRTQAAGADQSVPEPLHVDETLKLAYAWIQPALQHIRSARWEIEPDLPRVCSPRRAFLELLHSTIRLCDRSRPEGGRLGISARHVPQWLSAMGSGPALVLEFSCGACGEGPRIEDLESELNLTGTALELGALFETLPARGGRRGWRLVWSLAPPAGGEPSPGRADAGETRRSPRRVVLLVRENKVRHALEAILASQGHEVSAFDTYDGAELAFASGALPPDLVVLDMPQEEAVPSTFLDALIEHSPPPRLILLSMPHGSLSRRFQGAFREVNRLQKPVDREELLAVL